LVEFPYFVNQYPCFLSAGLRSPLFVVCSALYLLILAYPPGVNNVENVKTMLISAGFL
jgi:hypothetical protein